MLKNRLLYSSSLKEGMNSVTLLRREKLCVVSNIIVLFRGSLHDFLYLLDQFISFWKTLFSNLSFFNFNFSTFS